MNFINNFASLGFFSVQSSENLFPLAGEISCVTVSSSGDLATKVSTLVLKSSGFTDGSIIIEALVILEPGTGLFKLTIIGSNFPISGISENF